MSVNLFGVGIKSLKLMLVDLRKVVEAALSSCSMTGVGLLSADTVTRIAADRAPFPFQTNCLDDDLSLPAHYDDFKKKRLSTKYKKTRFRQDLLYKFQFINSQESWPIVVSRSRQLKLLTCRGQF